MAGPDVVLVAAWIGALVGPVLCFFLVRRLLRGRRIFLGWSVAASEASERWPCGLYDEGGRKLFVTGGVGVSILPVRFRAPPEIVVLTLKRPTQSP